MGPPTVEFIDERHRAVLKGERVALRRVCEADEPLLVVAVANRRSRPGLLAVTDRRVIFARLRTVPRKIDVLEFPVGDVVAVERFRAWRQPCLVVETAVVRITFRYLEGTEAADAVCAALATGSGCAVRLRRLLRPAGALGRARKLLAGFR